MNNFPIVTVGIVVLNREWIIGEMLKSLRNQDYPHEKIFVLIVDGGSQDNTVGITKEILEKMDLMGYDIIVENVIFLREEISALIE